MQGMRNDDVGSDLDIVRILSCDDVVYREVAGVIFRDVEYVICGGRQDLDR